MGPGEIIAVVIVALFVALAVALLVRNRKKGKKICGCPGCSGDCSGCAQKLICSAEKCEKRAENKEIKEK